LNFRLEERRMKPVHIFIVAALTALLLLPAVSAQDARTDRFQRRDLAIPDRTDAGVWEGTWYYISRDQKIALWIRTTDGLPEMQMQYFGFIMAEHFVTDWQGHADYDVKGRHLGQFDLAVTERDANTIKGSLDWTLRVGDITRSETGNFTMYRAGHGRGIVMRFDDYERVETTGTERRSWRPGQSWTFRKASKRLVLWEELPF
jgi:hypothetical protein